MASDLRNYFLFSRVYNQDMDIFVQGIKHLLAVISGVTLLVFPHNSPPPNLPSPAPILQQRMATPSLNPSDMITISGEYTYMKQGVHYSLIMPKAGGDISGTFSGLCNGSIGGQYGGGEGGSIKGKTSGDCSVAFLHQPLNITYSGNIWPNQGKLSLDWEGQMGPLGQNKGSFTLGFTPQP